MLLGRVAECAQLDELIAGARSGLGGSLVIVGEPGVGKTSLLEHAVESALEMTVLRVQGNETEIVTRGRHDPCVGIRAVPVGEAMMACVLADHLLRHRGIYGGPPAA